MDGMEKIFKSLDEFDKEMQNVPELGVTQDYDRKLYDNVYKREQYKNEIYGKRNTHEDYLTGNTLHKNSRAAANKYGRHNMTKHTGDVDHIVPLASVHDMAKANPFLTDNDVKEASNRWNNYRLTQSKLNRAKGGKINFEMAKEAIKKGEFIMGGKQIIDGTISTAGIGAEFTAKTVKNASEFTVKSVYKTVRNPSETISTAKKAITDATKAVSDNSSNMITSAKDAVENAQIYIGMAAVRNMCLIADGKMSVQEASVELGKMTARIGAHGVITDTADVALKNAAKSTGNQVLKKIGGSPAILLGVIAVSIAESVVMSLMQDKKLSAEQIFSDLFSNTLGSFTGLLQTAAMFPPYGGLVATSLLVTTVCSEIYALYGWIRGDDNRSREKLARISRLEREALAEMERQRNILKDIVNSHNQLFDEKVSKGFDYIFQGSLANNAEAVAEGLDEILFLVKKSVKFKTMDEFNKFFDDENSVLAL